VSIPLQEIYDEARPWFDPPAFSFPMTCTTRAP
jgi:hypothetical protein